MFSSNCTTKQSFTQTKLNSCVLLWLARHSALPVYSWFIFFIDLINNIFSFLRWGRNKPDPVKVHLLLTGKSWHFGLSPWCWKPDLCCPPPHLATKAFGEGAPHSSPVAFPLPLGMCKEWDCKHSHGHPHSSKDLLWPQKKFLLRWSLWGLHITLFAK